MAAAYLFGLICALGYVQAVPLAGEPAIIEDLRNADIARGSPRIVFGWEAQEGQFPYQVSLRMVNNVGGVSSCGGSVIHNKWVLTAAHCLANRLTFVVRFGLTNLSRPSFIVESQNKYIYPGYNEIQAGVQTDDIALLGLNHYIPYGPLVQPCRLQSSAQKNKEYDGITMVVSGWGRTDSAWLGGVLPENLLWVFKRGVTEAECRRWYPTSQVIGERTICANYYNVTGQGSCSGDSGGPLTVVDDDDQVTMVGVVSFGSTAGCSAPHAQGYVRPGHYHGWFEEVTGLNFDWDSDAIASDYQPEEVDPVMTVDI